MNSAKALIVVRGKLNKFPCSNEPTDLEEARPWLELAFAITSNQAIS